ncbi:MAG: DUF2341 domain-containing protein [Chitinispirillaceae bacterium]|nr:DUF2341 domain-containing protein [Chitinispirillaceae bacterium]
MRNPHPLRTGILMSAAVIGALVGTHCIAPLGGGSEAGNARITGMVVDTSGTPAGGVVVTVRPSDFDPVKDAEVPAANSDTTGPDGIYRVSVRKGATYTIDALVPIQGTRTLVAEVKAQEAETTAPQCTVKTPGTVKVMIPENADHVFGYLFIPGTGLFTFLNDRTGFVVIDSVSAGVVPEVAYSSTNSTIVSTVRYAVPVPSSDTVVVFNPSWKYARQLVLNTTPTGADVSGDVIHFPVCVRLTPSNFVFDQAREGGADLRFTKMDNTPFSYEVERWDPVAGRAEVWVTVDTVFGNSANQSIMMYWGNAAATDRSSAAAVFSTAAGFQGVWHLAGEGIGPAGDATINRYDGASAGVEAPSAVEGIIGAAREFDGVAGHFVMANTAASTLNFPENGPYTLSAWVYADTLDGAYHTVASKGNRQYNIGIMGSQWGFTLCPASGGYDVTNSAAEAKAWTHLVGIRNGALQYLYVNGVCVDSSITNTYPGTTRYTGDDLAIGANPSKSADFFNGTLDEVRISGVARDPAWIKLSYMNQTADDRLVSFR